jgi:hypothetical protein
MSYSSSRRYDIEHKAHLSRVSKLPLMQRPMDATYWKNKKPTSYIPEGLSFEQWKQKREPV